MAKSNDKSGPKGFRYAVAEAAIKKPGRKDIGLILSDIDANMAGAFTRNSVKAAPVILCKNRIKSGMGRAIIVNSGNANACTGKQGLNDALKVIKSISKAVSVNPDLTYMCSTGVIGSPLPMDRILLSLPTLAADIGLSRIEDVAAAIMTTDTFPKIVNRHIKLGNTRGTISGICKGAGMIAPNMATMLCFIITDIAISQKALQTALTKAVNKSFNRITIDGDMSTNDTVLCMANGLAGNKEITLRSPSFRTFSEALEKLAYELSRLIVKDGEGATKLIEVIVKGAKTESDAEKAAFAVANSNLVKTAVYGNDANWGRIMAAVGYSGCSFSDDRVDISLNGIKVAKSGLSAGNDKKANQSMRSTELTILIELNVGRASSKVLTCDFSEDYVRINAEYRT